MKLNQKGIALVEVVIGILLTAIIVTGTFSALLMTQANLIGSDSQAGFSLAQRQLLESLKNYHAANFDAGAGPNGGLWTFPSDSGLPCGANCAAQCQAIGPCGVGAPAMATACVHTVTAMLPANLRAAPLNGTMCYIVSDLSGTGDQSQLIPNINVYVRWTGAKP